MQPPVGVGGQGHWAGGRKPGAGVLPQGHSERCPLCSHAGPHAQATILEVLLGTRALHFHFVLGPPRFVTGSGLRPQAGVLEPGDSWSPSSETQPPPSSRDQGLSAPQVRLYPGMCWVSL